MEGWIKCVVDGRLDKVCGGWKVCGGGKVG